MPNTSGFSNSLSTIAGSGTDSIPDIYLPIILHNYVFRLYTETQPDSNGQVMVTLPSQEIAEFQLFGEDGEIVPGLEVTSVADFYGVTLVIVDANVQYMQRIISVPTISLTLQSQEPTTVVVENTPYDVQLHPPSAAGMHLFYIALWDLPLLSRRFPKTLLYSNLTGCSS